jgi:hypothetical protein
MSEPVESISSRKGLGPEGMVLRTPASKKQKKPIQFMESVEELEEEPIGKRFKSSSEEISEDQEKRSIPIREDLNSFENKQFDRLMEKYKVKIPVLRVKGLKEDQRLIEFSSWKIKMRTVFEYYRLVNVIYRDAVDDIELPEGHDPRRMNDQEFSNYIMEISGQDLSPTNPQLKALKEKNILKWIKYDAEIESVYKKQILAHTIIMEGLDNELTNKYVLGHEDLVNQPKKLWEEINKDFYPDDQFTIHFQINEFGQMKINSSENIEDFAQRIKDKAAQLRILDIYKSEKEMITQLIAGISRDDGYRTAWMACNNQIENVKSVERAARIIEQYAKIVRDAKGDIKSKILSVGKKGQKKSKPNRFGKSDKLNLSNVECFNCHKKGHFKKDCPSLSKEDKNKFNSKKKSKNKDGDDNETIHINLTRVMEEGEEPVVLSNSVKEDTIIMDSGAEVTAMNEVPDGMIETKKNPKLSLVYGNKGSTKVQRIGRLGDLTNIHISADISDNVLSLSQVTELGYKVLITNSKLYLLSPKVEFDIKKKHVMLTADRHGKLYKAHLNELRELFSDDKEGEKESKSSSKK